MTSIKNAELAWNEAGTPVSDHFDDVYFSNVNGLEETRYVFLQQNHLPQRWVEADQRRFVIGETGFGTGLNFLAVWQWFEQFRREHPDAPLKELHFISFEKFPLSKADLIKAHQAWPELAPYAEQLQAHYPIAVAECQRIVLADGAITLDLWFGDIKDCLPKVPTGDQGIIDAWFLDGFAPSKNPEMWNQNLFNGMASLAKSGATCATFTAAGFVRRGLIEAGFEMKKVKGFGTKREMIAGHLPQHLATGNHKAWFQRTSTPNVTDVAIIGGGIASATLAKTLTQRGINVTLYCADEQAAQGASGNHQAALYPLLNAEHSGVSRVFAPAFLFARQFINQMATQIPFDYDWCGVTQLMWDESTQQKLTKLLAGQFDPQLIIGCDAEQTNTNAGLPLDQPSVFYPLGGWVCPAQLTRGLIEQMQHDAPFTVHFNQRIEQLERRDHQWVLRHRNSASGQLEEMHHQVVVVANGHQFADLVPTADLPLSQVKGQVSHVPSNETLRPLRNVLCYDGYMTPVNPNNGEHCIGASYDTVHRDTNFDPQAQQENLAKLHHCVPDQPWTKQVDVSGNQSRQAIRCVSRDHLPFVGNVGDFEAIKRDYAELHHQPADQVAPVASQPDLYCFLGLGSRGFTSAPLLAELLASQICNDPLPLPVDVLEALHPSRMWVRRLRKGKALTELKRKPSSNA